MRQPRLGVRVRERWRRRRAWPFDRWSCIRSRCRGRLIHALGASNRPARPPDPRSPGVASTGCSSVRVRFSPPSIARGRSSVRGRADRPPPARSAAVCVPFSESGKVYSVRLSASRTGYPSGLPGAFPAITAWPPTGSGATGECWPGHESAGPASPWPRQSESHPTVYGESGTTRSSGAPGLAATASPPATTSQASAAANSGPAASGGRGRLVLGRIGQIGPAGRLPRRTPRAGESPIERVDGRWPRSASGLASPASPAPPGKNERPGVSPRRRSRAGAGGAVARGCVTWPPSSPPASGRSVPSPAPSPSSAAA